LGGGGGERKWKVSIKDLQESTNHLVEWFPICVGVFFFGLFLYKVDEQKVFTSLRVVVEWDEYQNVFCMQHAGLKICRPVKIELCGTKQVGEKKKAVSVKVGLSSMKVGVQRGFTWMRRS